MGTSSSSGGPSGNVPLVPSWVPTPDSSGSGSGGEASGGGGVPVDEKPNADEVSTTTPEVVLTPARGFAGARRSMGTFARSGGSGHMRQGLKHYVRTAYRGSGNATRRHGGTIKTAASLYNALSPSAPSGESVLDRTRLEGRSAEEVMDAVVEAVRPVDGTQDAESSRAAIHDALSDLLKQFPEADLLELTEEQRMFAVERYLTIDVFRRFQLDLGTTIQEKAPDVQTALARLKEVRDYIRETVSASFRKLRATGGQTNAGTIGRLAQAALKDAFQIFESYTS